MKKFMRFLGIFAVSAAVFFSGCASPAQQDYAESGNVTIKFGKEGLRTILPASEDLAIVSYTITGTGPSGATLEKASFTAASYTASDLEAGNWTFFVDGLNQAGTVVADGSVSLDIIPADTVSGTVYLAPLAGTGTFSMTANWDSPFDLQKLDGVIAPAGGTGTSVTFSADIASGSATYTNTALEAGSYILTLTGKDISGKTAKAIFALQVYHGMESVLTATAEEIASLYWKAAAVILTVDPPMVSDGVVNTEYTFTIEAANLGSLTSVDFAWNFGDGSATATGTATVSVTNGEASTQITHTYTSNSSFGLVVTVSDGTNQLADNFASVTIGQSTQREADLDVLNQWRAANSGGDGLTTDIWDMSVLPDGVLIDLMFNAYSIPDKIIIEYPIGNVVYNSGWRGDSYYESDTNYPGGIVGTGYFQKDLVFTKQAGNDTFKVTVIGGAPGTAWDYSMRARDGSQ